MSEVVSPALVASRCGHVVQVAPGDYNSANLPFRTFTIEAFNGG